MLRLAGHQPGKAETMDEALKAAIETPIYIEGKNAFDLGEPCPYEYGSPEAREWWSGWQEVAGAYIEAELEKVTKW